MHSGQVESLIDKLNSGDKLTKWEMTLYEIEQRTRDHDGDRSPHCKLHIEGLHKRCVYLLDGVNKDVRICDCGCRGGEGLSVLKEMGYTNSIGIDIVKDGIISCGVRGVKAIHGDVHTMESYFKPEEFDYVLLSHTLEHLLCPEVGLKSINKVMKPNGKLLIIIPKETMPSRGHYNNWGDSGELSKLVESCGFKANSWIEDSEIWCLAIKEE